MSFRSKLIGAWEMVSWRGVNKYNPSDVDYPMGKDIWGIIMYTPDGYVSAHLNKPGTPSYKLGPLQGSAEEGAQAAADTFAYSGPYYLEEGNEDGLHQLYHLPKVSMPRNFIDNIQGRPARIVEESGETFLYLEGPYFNDAHGVPRYPKIKWKKMKDNSQGKRPSTP